MSLEGSQTVPVAKPGPRLFVTGIVLGLTAGIAAGHLLLFSRSGLSVDTTLSAEEEFTRLVASSPRFAAVEGSGTSEDAACSILEFDGREDVGRVKLSLPASDEESLHYFPESLHAPAIRGVASEDKSSPAAAVPPGTLQIAADTSRPVEAPPQALQPPPGAEPIDKATSDREARARTIIKEELPDATDQEWEIWYDVLQGLPGEDIKGILRMRKHIDAQAGDNPPAPAPVTAPPGLVSRPAAPADNALRCSPDGHPDVVRRRLLIAEHNLANRQTVAYKQQVPVFVEAGDGCSGVSIHRVIRDMRQGELQSTDRALDVALDGPGFLQVSDGEEVRYTRDGRLTLDEAGRLMLLAPEQAWRLDPPIVIPGEAIDVVIDRNGKIEVVLPDQSTSTVATLRIVRFLDPSALSGGQDGLYQATPDAGRPHEVHSPGLPATEVMQRHVERSNSPAVPTQADSSEDPPATRR